MRVPPSVLAQVVIVPRVPEEDSTPTGKSEAFLAIAPADVTPPENDLTQVATVDSTPPVGIVPAKEATPVFTVVATPAGVSAPLGDTEALQVRTPAVAKAPATLW